MILNTATKANKFVTFRRGQDNTIIKGPLENKNNHSNHSKHNDNQEEIIQIQSNVIHPKESKIEIELNENQIIIQNYDVKFFNDDEATSSNRVNDDKDVDDKKDNEPEQKLIGK